MSKEDRCPRLLVVSINCFSETGSNGRVLTEFFRKWDKDKIAQLYVNDEKPDFDVCQQYFKITDRDVLLSLISKYNFGKVLIKKNLQECENSIEKTRSKKIPQNPLTYLLRDVMWRLARCWKNKEIINWIKGFSPDVLLYYAGNSSFLIDFVIKISERFDIPIVVYNTENYYFKKHNYLKGNGFGFLYPLFRQHFKNSYKKIIKKSIKQIHLNQYLSHIHKEEFQKPGEVIYHSSSLTSNLSQNSVSKFLYAGNLGLNRDCSLVEVAQALQVISNEYVIDVYGRAPSCEIEDRLLGTKGIRYHGVVSYDIVKNAIENTDFILYVESFDKYYVNDLVAAFSTKLADCLSSGKCLIMYTPESLACSQYVKENVCGCLISEPKKLEDSLRRLITDPSLQNQYVENALKTASLNHNNLKNAKRIKSILNDAISKNAEEHI